MLLFVLNYETGVCYKHTLTNVELAKVEQDSEDFITDFMEEYGMNYDECYWMLTEQDIAII